MLLTFLGTAAAEGLPAVWCNCPTCKRAKAVGGKEIRTRSQILVDDCLLVDFPMDTYCHALKSKLDLSKIDTVLITHAHMDHCYPQEFVLHGDPFAHGMTKSVVTVHGNATVAKIFSAHTAAEMRDDIAQTVPFETAKPFDSFVTESGYEITAFPAVHTPDEDCLIYAVGSGGKTALMFNDSGPLPDTTYDRMKQMNILFDLISFDCTYGHGHGSERHMGSFDAVSEREKMLKRGLVHSGTKYVLTHFSHNCKLSYDELVEKEREQDFIIAYDGMKIEI